MMDFIKTARNSNCFNLNKKNPRLSMIGLSGPKVSIQTSVVSFQLHKSTNKIVDNLDAALQRA